MLNATSFISGASLGAGLMYLLDPRQGRRRRKQILDQVGHAILEVQSAADITRRDVQNRSYGVFARLRSSMVLHDNSDRVVEARVRSKLGHYVSHPAAIRVAVDEGHVLLDGPILASEVRPLLSAVKSVMGVRSVANDMVPHRTAKNISALQGGKAATGETMEFLQRNWSPTARLCAGALGCAFMANCAVTRKPAPLFLGIVGLGLLGRAIFNERVPALLTPSHQEEASSSSGITRPWSLPTGNGRHSALQTDA